MNRLAVILPVLLVVGGVVTFFLLPVSPTLRAIVLAGDLLTAAVVAVVLIRRGA